jgi:hypothetical protein
MDSLEETVASATGLKEKKVLIEDQSFIYVPSPVSTPSLGSKMGQTGEEKHELITIANSRTKVLVIPDYVHNSNLDDSPTTSKAPTVIEANSLLANKNELSKEAVEKSKESVVSKSLPTSSKSESFPSSSPIIQPKQLTLDSFLTDVEFLQPLMLEILDVQGPIKTVEEFLDLKRTHNFLHSFLKEAGIAPHVDDLIERVRARLPSPTSSAEQKVSEKVEEKIIEEVVKEPIIEDEHKPKKNEVEGFPIGVIDGLGADGKGPFITKHAYIYTVGELAAFPIKFPSIYAMLKETGLMTDLDAYIERAKELIALGENIAKKTDMSASILSRTVRPVSLEQSWLRPPTQGKIKIFDVLLKAPFRNEMVSVTGDTNIFALEGLDSQEVEMLMTRPTKPIKTLKDLAAFDELTTEAEKLFLYQRIPLLDQFILHAQALSK